MAFRAKREIFHVKDTVLSSLAGQPQKLQYCTFLFGQQPVNSKPLGDRNASAPAGYTSQQ